MNRRKKAFYVGFACIAVIGMLYYFIFSSNAILKNVSQYRGYTVEVSQEVVPIEMFIEPQMYNIKEGTEKTVNQVVHRQNNTSIILESVIFREDYLFFNFTTDYALPFVEGEFLYNGIFHSNGSFTTTGGGWDEYEAKTLRNEQLEIGQTGSGPNSDFGFSLYKPQLELLNEGFTIRYNGMYLYNYKINLDI